MGAFIVRRLLGDDRGDVRRQLPRLRHLHQDPGRRSGLADGRQESCRRTSPTSAKQWGFDKPFYVQYVRMMQKTANGLVPASTASTTSLRSFDARSRRRARDQARDSRDDVALHRRSDHLALLRDPRGRDLGGLSPGGSLTGLITTSALIGMSMPVFWLGLVLRFFLAEKPNDTLVSGRRVRRADRRPGRAVAHHLILPWFCLSVLLHRVLRAEFCARTCST